MIDVEQLRSLIARGPSARRWEQVFGLFEGADVGPDGDSYWALEYAIEHLSAWPAAVRVAPPEWVMASLSGEAVPCWPLARTVYLKGANTKELTALCKSPAMASIERLELARCKIGPKAGIKALTKSKHLGAVRALRIEYGVLGDEGLATLLESPLCLQLETFELAAMRVGSPAKLSLTHRSIDALAAATHLENLRHLVIAGTFELTHEVGLSDVYKGDEIRVALQGLATAPHVQALTSLWLQDRYWAEVDAFLGALQGGSIARLDLRESSVVFETMAAFLAGPCAPHLRELGLTLPPMKPVFYTSGTIALEGWQAICETKNLGQLEGLSLVVNGLETEALLQAPWASQLRSLSIEGRLDDEAFAALALDPVLEELASVTLSPLSEDVYYGGETSERLDPDKLPGEVGAVAWLQTKVRAHLSQLHASHVFFLDEAAKERIRLLAEDVMGGSPDFVHEGWCEALTLAGVLPSLVEASGEGAFSLLEASECISITLTYMQSANEKKVAALLEGDTLSRCRSLTMDPDVVEVPLALWLEIFSSPQLANLRSLELSFSNWQWSEDGQLNQVLLALAHNQSLGALESLSLGISIAFESSLRGFLALKTAPHIKSSVRDSLRFTEYLPKHFGLWDASTGVLWELCECEGLQQLEVLDFGKARLGDQGAAAFASCEYLSGLRSLLLPSCHIGDEGAIAIAASPYFTQLEKLDLNYNKKIGVVGMEALANSPYLPAAITKKWAVKWKKKCG